MNGTNGTPGTPGTTSCPTTVLNGNTSVLVGNFSTCGLQPLRKSFETTSLVHSLAFRSSQFQRQ